MAQQVNRHDVAVTSCGQGLRLKQSSVTGSSGLPVAIGRLAKAVRLSSQKRLKTAAKIVPSSEAELQAQQDGQTRISNPILPGRNRRSPVVEDQGSLIRVHSGWVPSPVRPPGPDELVLRAINDPRGRRLPA